MASRIQPTDAQLLAAWALWRRPGWPATWPATQANPLYFALVRGAAVRTIMAAQKQARRAVAPPSTAALPLASRALSPMPRYDPKRLAAGDRDDD